jgi:glutathione synthase/RimK-type ligase-like ATP-grasp enzyme
MDDRNAPLHSFVTDVTLRRLSSRIAIATSRKWIDLPESDRILADALRRRGHRVSPLVWSSSAADFDAVVIRSCWDYHLRVDEFLTWVDGLTIPVINPPSIVRWNARKTYLFDLAARGIAVVPSRHIVDGALTPDLFDADRLVVKPVVGASSWGTRVINRADGERVKDVLVQPYVVEIASGEWSLIVIDGLFTHSVLKRPTEGDFRVQAELGGRITLAHAPDHLRAHAERVVATVHPTPAYARVDVVETADGPLLMELELIEPELFYTHAPDSVSFLCDAIERRLP